MGSISLQLLPSPAGFVPGAPHGVTPEASRLARRYRVRLRVQKRDGLFFRLRPLLRRRGLWAGLFLFLPLLLWLQGAVWATDFTTLTPGQRARAEVILRQQARFRRGVRLGGKTDCR